MSVKDPLAEKRRRLADLILEWRKSKATSFGLNGTENIAVAFGNPDRAIEADVANMDEVTLDRLIEHYSVKQQYVW